MKHIHDREHGANSYVSQAAQIKPAPTSKTTTCKFCKTKFIAVANYKNELYQLCKPCHTKAREDKKQATTKNPTPKHADFQLQQAKKQAKAAKALMSLQLESDDEEHGLGYVSENEDASAFFCCAMTPLTATV